MWKNTIRNNAAEKPSRITKTCACVKSTMRASSRDARKTCWRGESAARRPPACLRRWFSCARDKGHRYLVRRLFGDFNIYDSIIKVTKVSIIGGTWALNKEKKVFNRTKEVRAECKLTWSPWRTLWPWRGRAKRAPPAPGTPAFTGAFRRDACSLRIYIGDMKSWQSQGSF